LFAKVIAIWGLVALASAVMAGLLAGYKRLDHSWWAGWSFIFPPMLLLLVLLRANAGPRRRQPTLDEQDAAHGD